MKHWSKLLAILLTMAMTLALAVPMSFAKGTNGSEKSPVGLKVISMSDTHTIAESMIKDSKEYRDDLHRDQKLLNESEAILNAQLKVVREKKPDVLILSGDLTKDGEYKGHQLIAKKLRKLKKDLPRLKVYVINGNHDINNSNAMEYKTASGKARPAKKTTMQDFRAIYDGITYSDKTVKETYGLSYVARPKKGYTVIALDSNCYLKDTTKNGKAEHETRGALQPDVLQWALKQTKSAVKRGDTVIGVMHHGLVAHFTQEPTILGAFLVDDYQDVSRKLADAGMHYVFTGHFHSQDVSFMRTEKGNALYDIETGSAITYPCGMRAVQFQREDSAKSDNGVSESVVGTTIEHLSIAHTNPQTGRYEAIPDMTTYARTRGLNADTITTALKVELQRKVTPNYPAAVDTVIDTVIHDVAKLPVTNDRNHTLMQMISYAHSTHLAGLDNGHDPAWYREARANVASGKTVAALTDVLCKDLAVLTGKGVNQLAKADLVKGPTVDLLYHALFGAAQVPYYTAPKLAKDLDEFLVVTLDSLTHDTNYPDDLSFRIYGANVVKPGQADWSSIESGISKTNVIQRLVAAILGNK